MSERSQGSASRGAHRRGAARIWAVAGGKGGTGKSFVAASLGLLLAERALSTNLIDADLGAPNLHTFLGIKDPEPNLGDFFYRKGSTLNDLAISTQLPALRLISGPTKTLFANNLKYFQKRKFLNQIRRLDGNITIVDIGAGTVFNSLDFFLVSDLGVLVVTPDPPSLENAYHFLRSAAFRTLEGAVRRLGVEDLLKTVLAARHRGPRSVPELLNDLSRLDRGAAKILAGTLRQRPIYLILNKARSNSVGSLGSSICDVAEKCLGTDLRFLGSIPWDAECLGSLQELSPYVLDFPQSKAGQALRSLASNLINQESQAVVQG